MTHPPIQADDSDDSERSADDMPRVVRRSFIRRVREVEFAGDAHFPPVANGLDYLVSVVELLQREEGAASARDLKYAVLHLAAGAEVLLKSRLHMEHWSLVFTDPGAATCTALEDGSLSSCTPEQTRKRLKNIVGITFASHEEQALKDLASSRNALQHWGLIGDQARAAVVASTTATVLNFLVSFVDNHLLPELKEPERSAAELEMEHVRDGLHYIEEYVRERMKDLAPRLGPVRPMTVQCPLCGQWALVVPGFKDGPDTDRIDDTYNVECLFCSASFNAVEAAHEYNAAILGCYSEAEEYDGPEGIYTCPLCPHGLLIRGVSTAADRERPVDFCFACATSFDNLQKCQRCGAVQPAEEEHRCPFARSLL
ncbi:hypothetical protein [Streptomyces glycanivorans]|uniref:Uncharacterized protein n=1 Tax=Streptomyces glycanivorans TaxID=3033808 RepID=A0ABY9JAT1_9ACTN|nr:hypothetical protein [Streptomyces sp. Alt3]WLQ63373.1 hypothetical protein P8A20_07075 [Streptomyces sp. Alt3]